MCPELGESVVEARVAKWLKKEGDRVSIGDPLVELETEKIDLEVSADREGVLSAIKHGEGDDVKVGEVLATLEPAAGGASASVAASADKPVARQSSGGQASCAGTRRRPAGDAGRPRHANGPKRRQGTGRADSKPSNRAARRDA